MYTSAEAVTTSPSCVEDVAAQHLDHYGNEVLRFDVLEAHDGSS